MPTENLLCFEVQEPAARLDAFLASTDDRFSRAQWQKICQQGLVLVNQKQGIIKQKLRAGDVVAVDLPHYGDNTAIEIPIIYQDDDVIVINKPAGVLTHSKGVINSEFTVADFVRPFTTDAPDSNRPGIVHRLDRDTSGVMIAARTHESKTWIQKQFATRKVKKSYIALVNGTPKEPTALLDLPIERNPKKPQTFRVGVNGKTAQTTYETLHNYDKYTLLKLMPKTGRTHQLRVHTAYLNCPIVGDRFYAEKFKKQLDNRLFLHANTLELTLPSHKRMVFEAPLPPDFTDFLDTLE